MYTIGVIIAVGLFLSVLGFFISNWLSITRNQFPHDAVVSTVSGEDPLTQAELDNILENIKVNTGSTASGTTANSGTITATGSK